MVKKSVALYLILSLCLQGASLNDTLKNFDGSLTNENAGYYKTQARGLYSLGSARVRFGGGSTVVPFNVRAPSISAGCGGIDMVFGGFSYLNFEFIVEKLKKIASAAPAFAFNIALSTLCKDCQTIMSELEKIANAINSMNFDTCQISQSSVNWGARQLGIVKNSNLAQGVDDSWLKIGDKMPSQIVGDFTNSMNNLFNDGGETVKEYLMQGSLLKKTMEVYNPIISSGKEFEYLTRALIGDVVGETVEGSDPKTQEPFSLKVYVGKLDIRDFKEVLLNGGEVKGSKVEYTENGGTVKDVRFSDENIKFDKGLKYIIKDKITEIYNAMVANRSLSADQLKFINSVPIPLYRILNVAVLADTDGQSMDLEKISETIALQIINALISTLLTDMSNMIASYKEQKSSKVIQNDDQEAKIRILEENARKVKTLLTEEINKQNIEWSSVLKTNKMWNELERELYGLSPSWVMSK
ncbi:conjugal transfer protein TraH [Campylobacter upsaliensis]